MSWLVVMFKEIIDNLRDKQTVFYALLFGPVLLPLILGGSIIASLKQLSIDFDLVTPLAVVNSDSAPNLMEFLYSHNIDVESAPDDPEKAVRRGDVPVVLKIMPSFNEALREGQPAPLTLYVNDGDKVSSKEARKVTALLQAYERTINALRLQHRGIDPNVFNSLDISREDVSQDGAGGQLLASLLPFLLIVSMVMGGFYLAIDTTAGERERQSLEPLLGLPLNRWELVLGKFGATFCFVLLSGILTSLSVFGLFQFFPTELLGGGLHFDGATLFKAFLLASPLTAFISAVLITVSAFTRSSKEAQTYLGLLMVIPMAPFFILQFINIKSELHSMPIPMMSQYQLLERVVLGDPTPAIFVMLSVAGTLLCAGLLLLLACRLYSRDRILM
jgi:sodium transport system permease protein